MVQAVRGVSFDVEAGRTLGIVGESGSGKSVATQTIVGLTQGARVSGQARLEGRDLLTMRREELRQVRGAEIALIFQHPLSSLHPHFRLGCHIDAPTRAHRTAAPSPTSPTTSSSCTGDRWWGAGRAAPSTARRTPRTRPA